MSHNRPIHELLAPNFQDLTDIYANEFSGMTVEKATLEELVEIRGELVTKLHQSLSDNDKEFLLSFKAGKPKWDMFDIPHLKDFPAIQWKLRNIDKQSFVKAKQNLAKLEAVLEAGLKTTRKGRHHMNRGDLVDLILKKFPDLNRPTISGILDAFQNCPRASFWGKFSDDLKGMSDSYKKKSFANLKDILKMTIAGGFLTDEQVAECRNYLGAHIDDSDLS